MLFTGRILAAGVMVFLLSGVGLAVPEEQQAARQEKVEITAPEEPAQPPHGIALDRPSTLVEAMTENHLAARAVEKNIGFFSIRIRERFSLWLSRSGKYVEMMKDILRKKDVPEDIALLSLVESGFNPHAYSIAHAAGPWQFIASTAKRFGLEINWWKDERKDPVKSTEAAADYLKELYGMFGSWNLALAAYNAGEGKILKAMKKSRATDFWDLLETKHIRDETKEYVPRFIAASLIASNPGNFGFDDIEYHSPLVYDEVVIEAPLDLEVVASCTGTTVEEIRRLNPELRRWCTPPDAPTYRLKIPPGTKETFLERLESMPEDDRFTIEHYRVKKGDTFKSISKNTGFPVPVILSLNSMEQIMPLKEGTRIYLPPKGLYQLDNVDRALLKKASYSKVSYEKKTPGSGGKSSAGLKKTKATAKAKPKTKAKAKKRA